MPARVNKINHDAKTKRLIQASQLLNRLISHANGECEMTPTQVQAAKIVIAKAIPDLRQTDLNVGGQPGNPINVEFTQAQLAKIATEFVKNGTASA